MMWAAPANAPEDWLLCNGDLVSRAAYAKLFAVIGTTYGEGDGSTTFALPDFRARTAVGCDSRKTNFATPNKQGGSSEVTLVAGHLPPHAHSGTTAAEAGHTHGVSATSSNSGSHTHTAAAANGGGHTHSITINKAGDHEHSINTKYDAHRRGSAVSGMYYWADEKAATTGTAGAHTHEASANTVADHTHNITVTSSGSHTHTLNTTTQAAGGHSHTFTTDNGPGSSTAINLMNPYLAIHYIIKT